MLLNGVSSTRLGSIIMNRTSLGELCSNRQQIAEFKQTVLPLPVAPAISRWGILDKSAAIASPPAPLPSARASLDLASTFWKLLVSITPRRLTTPEIVLGTSMPTTDLPGTGASILILGAARARARSLASAVILSTLTLVLDTSSSLTLTLPSLSLSFTSFILLSQPGSTPNWVTVGPAFICTTLASTP
ncbi:hypothetical protein ES703_31435 [subsurface metagenome]